MTLLAAAVIFVGCLCLLDLLLTFGVLRRLREHAALLAATPGPGLATGERPVPFVTVSTAGQAISGPSGLRMVAFFATSCSVCPGTIAPFLRYVKSAGLHQDEVLAVIATETEASDYLAELCAAAFVSLEHPQGGAVGHAFKLSGFPSFFLLDDDGAIVASAFDPDSLPEPVIA